MTLSIEQRIAEAEAVARKYPGSEIILGDIPHNSVPRQYQIEHSRARKWVTTKNNGKLAVSAVILHLLPL